MRRLAWFTVTMVMITALAVVTASCAKKMVQTGAESQPVAAAEPEAQRAPETPPAEPEVQKAPEQAERAGRAEEDRIRAEAVVREAATSSFLNENVHFTFDSAILSEQARQVLNSKADYLRMNPDINVTVEGHCDERGTDAYNAALGERRAETVKKFLVGQGIVAGRLNTVSYGEKRPIALGHNEASWTENRRAQLVIN